MVLSAFVINGVKDKKLKAEYVQDEIKKQLKIDDVHVYILSTSEDYNAIGILLNTSNSVDMETMDQLFPKTNIKNAVITDNIHITSNDTLFITHLPEKFDAKDEFEALIEPFGQLKSHVCPSGVHMIQFTKASQANHFMILFPLLTFDCGMTPQVTTEWYQVPIVHIVGIPKQIDVESLTSYLNEVAPVARLFEQVPNDMETYSANVLFKDNESTDKVIRELNFSKVEGSPLLFTHFATKGIIEQMKKWELRVTGFDQKTLPEDLMATFSQFGVVFSIHINPLPLFCIVDFVKQEDAEKAFNFFKDSQTEKLLVSYSAENSYLTISVYNFPHYIKESDIRKVFPKAINSKIIKSRDKYSTPIVIVNFNNEKDGEEAFNKGNNYYSRGLRLYCVPFINKDNVILEREKTKQKNASTNVILISNMKDRTTFEDVVKMCSEFGKLERVSLKSKNKKCTAIVTFTNEDDMEYFLDEVGDLELYGWHPRADYYEPPEKPDIRKKPSISQMKQVAMLGGYIDDDDE